MVKLQDVMANVTSDCYFDTAQSMPLYHTMKDFRADAGQLNSSVMLDGGDQYPSGSDMYGTLVDFSLEGANGGSVQKLNGTTTVYFWQAWQDKIARKSSSPPTFNLDDYEDLDISERSETDFDSDYAGAFPSNGVNVSAWYTCYHNITLANSSAFMDVATFNITTLNTVEGETGVPSDYFARIVKNYVQSLFSIGEQTGAADVVYTNPQIKNAFRGVSNDGVSDANSQSGLFTDQSINFLHSSLCGQISLALEDMLFKPNWVQYSPDNVPSYPSNRLSGAPSKLDADGYLIADTNVTKADYYRTLYAPVIRTYLPQFAAFLFAAAFLGLNILFCVLAALFTHLAKMQVKGSNENAFFDDLTVEDILQRRGKYLQYAGEKSVYLSNDPDAQRKFAFKNMLYCSEHARADHENIGGKAVRVGFSKADLADPIPDAKLQV